MTSKRSEISNDGNHVLCQRTESRDSSIPYFAIFENDTFFAKHSFQPRETCKGYIKDPVIRHVSKYFTIIFSENIGACFSVLWNIIHKK